SVDETVPSSISDCNSCCRRCSGDWWEEDAEIEVMIAPGFLRYLACPREGMVNAVNETLPPSFPGIARYCDRDDWKHPETKISAIRPESWTNRTHGHSSAEHPGRRGRPRNPDVDCEIPAQQRLPRHDRERRPRDGARHDRPSRRSHHPRRHAAGRGRLE